jgi:hypothetical protein
MTLPSVRFLPEALEELLETQRWYGMREQALASDFAKTLLLRWSAFATIPNPSP